MPESPSKFIKNPSVACNRSENSAVRFVSIDAAHEGQRLDNFLLSVAKGVPKSHIYRIVRGGEVRVNKKRATVSQRLSLGDCVRIPPMRMAQREAKAAARSFEEGELSILFEDRDLLIVDKPAGLACHGGRACRSASSSDCVRRAPKLRCSNSPIGSIGIPREL